VPPPRNSAAQKVSARFRTTSRLDREYLRNATRRRQSEKTLQSANYGHSRTGKLNSVYVGEQAVKNRTGVLTHPTGGHQAGHCHACSVEATADSVRHVLSKFTVRVCAARSMLAMT